ncbi:hypothetical protein HA466_0015190 [Hirschfeldia incana]|nr:hypothetical protein HA466_0015190 [Hirschfeldia incana]
MTTAVVIASKRRRLEPRICLVPSSPRACPCHDQSRTHPRRHRWCLRWIQIGDIDREGEAKEEGGGGRRD